MSCLSIRLPPLAAKKAWKSLTSKLQTRLHKLHKSKAIIKKKKLPYPYNINNPTPTRLQSAAAKTTRPSLFLGQRLQRINNNRHPNPKPKPKPKAALPFGYRRFYVAKHKAAAPVYVDNLFKDIAPLTDHYIHHQQREKKVGKLNIVEDEAEAEPAGTSNDQECMGMAPSSPPPTLLHGIDARAEEFIASFRAEMERQEIIARNL